MNSDLVKLALGGDGVLGYAGYVLLAGTFLFWCLVWPDGRSDRRLVALTRYGAVLLMIATIADPAIQIGLAGRQLGDATGALGGAALLVRLAALAAAWFFLPDLIRGPLTGRRRVFALTVVGVLAATLIARSDAIGGPWESAKIVVTTGHVLATAAWLGGLVALAAVLIPQENLDLLDLLIPRFSVVATVSVAVLFVTGLAHALAVAGGPSRLADSLYGAVLLVKVVVFGAMLILGNHGRRYAARAAFRLTYLSRDVDVDPGTRRLPSLAVVMGAELTIGLVILATTSVLVLVSPQ